VTARPGHRAGGLQGEHSLQVPRAPHPPDPHQGGAASGLGGYADPDPPELEEAALVDGCTRRQAFRRIVFPLLAPGVMVTSLFGFITIWNEVVFVNALMQSPENSTLPRRTSAFQTVLGTDWGATMAAWAAKG
jgi:ABC-type glycerol-3-phosphate transport system permease component